MLDLQFQDAEKKGIEIPDDLKKVRTKMKTTMRTKRNLRTTSQSSA